MELGTGELKALGDKLAVPGWRTYVPGRQGGVGGEERGSFVLWDRRGFWMPHRASSRWQMAQSLWFLCVCDSRPLCFSEAGSWWGLSLPAVRANQR